MQSFKIELKDNKFITEVIVFDAKNIENASSADFSLGSCILIKNLTTKVL